MHVSYKKLWKLLIDRDLKRTDLREIAGISSTSLAKLGKNENVTTDVLVKICAALECDFADIMELVRNADSDGKDDDNMPLMPLMYRVNSFFAGIGGFDLGFERANFETIYQCEIDNYCTEVLADHWPEMIRDKDINAINLRNIPDAEVWCGGFPCQDVSVASGAVQRLGLNGERSGLFFTYAKLLAQKRPKVVLIENVEGLFNSNGGRDFGVILQHLNNIGYAVSWRLLNSRYFGVPQSRPRVFICGWYRDPVKATRALFESDGAESPHNQKKDFLTEANNPSHYPKIPHVAYCLAATSGRHTGTDWSRTYVVCKNGVRRLTPIEYERLQGFPDNWTLPSSHANDHSDDMDTLRYTATGNAVSVPLISWIANRISNEIPAESKNSRASYQSIKDLIPEFFRAQWSDETVLMHDFTDTDRSYKWAKAGVVWKGRVIHGNVPPTPSMIIDSSLLDIVEKEPADEKYYITSNAAEGILRRVNSQGRRLFSPLQMALEELVNAKEKEGNRVYG